MIRFIINADDCGYSSHVNSHIKSAIKKRLISSTTIMANMPAFEEAINLYKEFYEQISFGCHLNLTEGTPLLFNEELLKVGFYKMEGGRILMNGKYFRYKFLSKSISDGIYRELKAQIERILDSGVRISHLDSHHHIHTAPFILPIVSLLSREFGILKVRNMRNYIPFSMSCICRKMWRQYLYCLNSDIYTTDYFSSFAEFYSLVSCGLIKDNVTIELMCHPGGCYPEEDILLEQISVCNKYKGLLVTYNQV